MAEWSQKNSGTLGIISKGLAQACPTKRLNLENGMILVSLQAGARL
jgi:hypothetical protein